MFNHYRFGSVCYSSLAYPNSCKKVYKFSSPFSLDDFIRLVKMKRMGRNLEEIWTILEALGQEQGRQKAKDEAKSFYFHHLGETGP